MQVGVLQFFGWRDRSVPLPSSTTWRSSARHHGQDGLRRRVARRAPFLQLFRLPIGAHDGRHGGRAHKRLRIGTAVSLAPFYNPLRLAEEVALLDVLSGGRVNWGAGRGFERSEFEAFGIPGEESASRFHETVDIVLKAWTNEQAYYQGQVHQLRRRRGASEAAADAAPAGVDGRHLDAGDRVGGGKGFSILMDPHSSRADLMPSAATTARSWSCRAQRSRPRHSHGAADRHRRDGRKGPRSSRRAAQWTLAAYVGPTHVTIARR